MTNQANLKQAMVQTLNGLDLSTMEVTYSERIRSKRELIIHSKLNLLMEDAGTHVLLMIEHRELDYGSSFSLNVLGHAGERVGSMMFADTELPVELVRRIDGMIASLPIENGE